MIRFPLNILKTKQTQLCLLLHVSCFLHLFLYACSPEGFPNLLCIFCDAQCQQVVAIFNLRPNLSGRNNFPCIGHIVFAYRFQYDECLHVMF